MCTHNIWTHVCDGTHKHVHAHVQPVFHVFASHLAHLTRNRCLMFSYISATVRAVSTYTASLLNCCRRPSMRLHFSPCFCADTFLALVSLRTSVTGCVSVLVMRTKPHVAECAWLCLSAVSFYTLGEKMFGLPGLCRPFLVHICFNDLFHSYISG